MEGGRLPVPSDEVSVPPFFVSGVFVFDCTTSHESNAEGELTVSIEVCKPPGIAAVLTQFPEEVALLEIHGSL